MSTYLQTTYSKPLEREYEAWIIAGIERYLKAIGLAYAVWAVSPSEEVSWPADERLSIRSKLVGLQFKQAKLASGPLSAERLHWSFHQPTNQFLLVQSKPEIYYCLPTFINREFRGQALEHCIFWRPSHVLNMNAWYDNPNANTPYKNISGEMRWGFFLESVLNCSIGKLITSEREGYAAIEYIRTTIREFELPNDNYMPQGTGLYVLVVEQMS